MHEAVLAQNLVKIVRDAFQGHEGSIKRIHVSVGVLSGILPEALTFAFEVVKRGTLLQNAQLCLIPVPVKAQCRTCGFLFSPQNFPCACPQCNATTLRIVEGEDFTVVDMELSHGKDCH